MPAGRIDQTIYVGPFQSIEAINTATLYKPGELGSQVQTPFGKAYQLIQVDSGATAAATPGHAPQTGDLAFWKDRSKYLVTNDRVQAQGGVTNSRNMYAGVFVQTASGSNVAGTASISAGNYGVVQQRGQHVGVLTSAATLASGLTVIVSSSATAPDGVNSAVGTAPIAPVVGIATAANGAVTATYTPTFLGGWDSVDVP